MASVLASSALAVSCGTAGETESAPCALCGDFNDLRGSIASMSGGQAQMLGWVVVALERDTNIARVGEVDNAGLYTLSKMRTNQSQTMALLTPDYILQAVLSIPGTVEKTIRQFVKFGQPTIPKLINNGPIITFQDFSGLTIMRDIASDQNGDMIPDGSVSLGATAVGLNLQGSVPDGFAVPDQDLDGIPNDKDPDIDGDGIANILDPDDNGNGVLDVFDGDANGDLFNDKIPGRNDTDQYFKEGVEFVSVQFEMRPKTDGPGNETTLTFTTKVRDDVTPLAVQVRGAPSLLNASTYVAYDVDGNPQQTLWRRQLMDDGLSEDANPGDRLFAKRVVLPNSKTPRAHEMVFFQLAFGSLENPWFLEFPYIFPDIKPAAISAEYDKTTKSVLLLGNPFGEIQDYMWNINLWDAETGKLYWTSQAIPGRTKQFSIQENMIDSQGKYKFSVVAQTLHKIPSYPSYAIHSAMSDLK